jgi:hypothetical protein
MRVEDKMTQTPLPEDRLREIFRDWEDQLHATQREATADEDDWLTPPEDDDGYDTATEAE